MKKDFPNFNQILLLGKQWDMQGEPRQSKEGFLFESFGGKKLLHIAPLNEAAFGFCLQKYLYQRGFSRGARFIPNKYGDAYAIWGDYGAYLTDYYAESSAVSEKEFSFLNMAGLLAEFHNAAEGLEIPGAPLENINSPLEYAFWLTEQAPPPMTLHMLPIYEKLCQQAQKNFEKCDNGLMKELCEAAKEQKQVIHGRFRTQTLCEFYGELLIRDFANASYGLPVWDLAYLLHYALLKLGKEPGLIHSMLGEYEKRRRLSRDEKAMLRLLVQLPMEFIYGISDWHEQQLTGEDFAELLLLEERALQLKDRISL
ncbi:MAG: hypothetical protein IJP33_04675 [Firmicutes bacterium]|nr:hypothetical protein [Bacillota bacterium]